MNITATILYIHPTLEFWVDFEVVDNWSWPVLTWINEAVEQPTQEELDAAWIIVEAEQIKQYDMDDFEKKDEYIDGLEIKIARLKARKSDPNCTSDNKTMMQAIVDNLQIESDIKEIEIQNLLTTIKATHWVGIAIDYAEKIKNKLWNI